MITVAGFNTAIDRLIHIDTLTPGDVHRVREEKVYPGGKGVHVAQTIAALGEKVQLIGLVDATHRDFIARRMRERGVAFQGVMVGSELRQCFALKEKSGRMTEILGQGPQLSEAEGEALLAAFRQSVENSELVILSGSLPRGLPDTTYAELVDYVNSRGKRCLVDASGAALRHAIDAKPYLVKPNRDEVSDLVGNPVIDMQAAEAAAIALRERGIAMPVVTMGELGAVAAGDAGVWHAQLSPEHVRNAVGSGDCFLAGTAVALQRHMSLAQALRMAVACGVANAQSEETGFAESSVVESLLPTVHVQRIRPALGAQVGSSQ
ncbi:1-phosphofructokinase family hexose kinase [Dyella sp. 2HG41-7]|uniref:1-phosphofructokinase family hexose kinase n=1 Tax=Dyella sp. 2HG41-7 TaxID=2883239 RepID=UPI001F3837FE|nr:1-phosphofructokinase family hexose kinase [Dyella sp. 2HG41-7]